MKNIKILMLLCLLLLSIVGTCFAMYQNEMSQVIEQNISAILKSKASTSCIVTCHAANTVLNPSLQRTPTFTTQEKPMHRYMPCGEYCSKSVATAYSDIYYAEKNYPNKCDLEHYCQRTRSTNILHRYTPCGEYCSKSVARCRKNYRWQKVYPLCIRQMLSKFSPKRFSHNFVPL